MGPEVLPTVSSRVLRVSFQFPLHGPMSAVSTRTQVWNLMVSSE